MSLSAEQYLALSSLAYSDIGYTGDADDRISIGRLIDNNRIDEYYGKDGKVALEFRALSSLSDWVVVNVSSHQTVAGAGSLSDRD